MSIWVLEPVGERAVHQGALAPRLQKLSGTVGILDDGFPGMVHHTFVTWEELLRERGLKTKSWVKPNLSLPAPTPTIEEIVSTCNGVIVGVCA